MYDYRRGATNCTDPRSLGQTRVHSLSPRTGI